MISSNKELVSISSKVNYDQNNDFISIRNEIIVLLKKINSSIDNNSSTYYLSLFYIDNIFSSEDFNVFIKEYFKYKIQIQSEIKKIYIILAISCLIIATKFNENDPHFPGGDTFLRLGNKFTDYIYFMQINDLVEGEIIILKLLKYRLNYYSTYNFLVFFFGHGIIAENVFDEIKSNKNLEKKPTLEKIYVLSREILDLINNNNSNESIEILNKNNYITAIIILCYSIEQIIDIKLDDNINTNVFLSYYNINIDNNIKQTIYNLIKNLYSNRVIKNNIEKKNNTFRYTYSASLFNNKKKINNYSLYSLNNKDYKDNKNKIISNNYMINTLNTMNSNQNDNVNNLNYLNYLYNNMKLFLKMNLNKI